MKNTLILLAVTFCTFSAMAQRPQRGQGQQQGKRPAGNEMRHKGPNKSNHMMKDLDLTADQTQQMKIEKQTFGAKMKAIDSKENITVKEKRDQRFAITKEHRNAVQQILTPEQKQKMETRRKKQGDKMETQRMNRMSDKLSLTEAQQVKMKAIQEKNRDACQDIRNNQGLDRIAKETATKKLREDMKLNMEKVLTKEQLTEWNTMPKQGPNPCGQGRRMHRPDAI